MRLRESTFKGIDKLHLEFILSALKPNLEDIILDVGCGSGRCAYAINSKHGCEVTGVDIVVPQLKYVFPFVRASAENLPFKDNAFNNIFAKDVWSHIPNDFIFLKEINRVLKPGGKLCINAPLNPRFSLGYILSKITRSYPLLPWDKETGHFHRYKYETVKKMMREAGFMIKEFIFGEFFLNVLIVFCLVPLIVGEKKQKRASFHNTDRKMSGERGILSTIFKLFYTENEILWNLLYQENKLLFHCPLGSTLMMWAEKIKC